MVSNSRFATALQCKAGRVTKLLFICFLIIKMKIKLSNVYKMTTIHIHTQIHIHYIHKDNRVILTLLKGRYKL